MKAFLIYDNFLSAAKANAALHQWAAQSELMIQWDIRPWRAEMLKFSPLAEEAITDALDAHMLIFVSDYTRLLPFWLEDWLEEWLRCRHFRLPGNKAGRFAGRPSAGSCQKAWCGRHLQQSAGTTLSSDDSAESEREPAHRERPVLLRVKQANMIQGSIANGD